MTKQIAGVPPRCGKSIRYHICPDCHTPLNQIDETTFCCPVCKHKLKALTDTEKPAIRVEAPTITGTLQLTNEDDREREIKEWFIKRLNENTGRGRVF